MKSRFTWGCLIQLFLLSNIGAETKTNPTEDPVYQKRVGTLEKRWNALEKVRLDEQNKLANRYQAEGIEISTMGGRIKGSDQKMNFSFVTEGRVVGIGMIKKEIREELMKMEAEVKVHIERSEVAKKDLEEFRKTRIWKEPSDLPSLENIPVPEDKVPERKPSPSTSVPPRKSTPPPLVEKYNPVGKTEMDVIGQWGEPQSRMEMGGEVQLTFPSGSATFEDGVCTKYKPGVK